MKNVQANNKSVRNNNAVVATMPVDAEQHTVVAEQHTVAQEQAVLLNVPTVFAEPPMSAQQVAPVQTVAQQRRAFRVALVGNTLRARRNAEKMQQSAAATLHAKHAAYMADMQALALKHGLPAPTTMSVRSVVGEQKNAPSNTSGACKRVRAFVHANPTLTRKQVQEHFGIGGTDYINPATVSTQFQLAKNGKA